MELRCPRCGNPVREGARFCAGCGLTLASAQEVSLSQPAGSTPVSFTPPPSAAQPGWPTSYVPSPPPAWPSPARNSVVALLTPTRPASALFWVGLVLTILALVMAACPALLAFAVTIDPRIEEPEPDRLLQSALGVSCCIFAGLLIPGVFMVLVGRPRRQA